MNPGERFAHAYRVFNAGTERVKNNPAPELQKYKPGTFVWIDKPPDSFFSHFLEDRPAYVEYTYAHAYGGSDVDSYSLIVRYNQNLWSSVSWFYESQLTLIEDLELIKQFQQEIDRSKNNKALRSAAKIP